MTTLVPKFQQPLSNAVNRPINLKLQETVSILDFIPASVIASGTATTACDSYIQNALNSLSSGGALYIPTGTYLITNPILVPSNVTIHGDGYNQSILKCNLDIEVLYTSRATLSTNCANITLMDFCINKTISTTTQFDIHLYNPIICNLIRIQVYSGRGDSTLYPNTDVSGIWLDKPSGSTTSSYINLIEDCWCNHCCLYLNNVTDSQIRGGFYWGHTTPYAIRLASCGNIDICDVQGIITSSYYGGIWLDTAANQIRIINNEWDGNPALTTQRGDGIYAPQSTNIITVIGNTFWGCAKNGINITNPVGWTITGNNFWKNNTNNNYYDDIAITSTFQCSGNVISSNVFQNDNSSITNPGYAIHEINGGSYPINNVYSDNTIPGGAYYASPGIKIVAYANIMGNFGNNMQNLNWLLGNSNSLGFNGSGAVQINAASGSSGLSANGVLTLTINPTFGQSPGSGGSGILCVTSTRVNYNQQSTRTIYYLNYYGTTAVFTSASSQNGSGGGNSFTLTMASTGVVTFTDTSGQTNDVRISFVGALSLN